MAERYNKRNISADDTLDINELASLNNDISEDFITQLQNQVSKNAQVLSDNDDASLFEEVQNEQEVEDTEPATNSEPERNTPATLNNDLDDNFIKKYKAKLMKQQNISAYNDDLVDDIPNEIADHAATIEEEQIQNDVPEQVTEKENIIEEEGGVEVEGEDTSVNTPNKTDNTDIEAVSGGNITEKEIRQDQIDYKEKLDYIDNNTKYSKYVIYIDPENKEFIDSLTVKERKNLINRIIREQDEIAVTKRKLNKTQTIIRHAIIALLTIILAVPVIYWAINASLEATINNYRSSQSNFQTLYREHGKIKVNTNN